MNRHLLLLAFCQGMFLTNTVTFIAVNGLAESQVQYVKGRREVGWNLAKDLGVTRAVQVDSLSQGRIGTADAVIIVGKDLAK